MPQMLNARLLPKNPGIEWVPVIAGLLVLYVPTFYDLATWHWTKAEYAHGPLILAVVVWLVFDKRQVLQSAPTSGNLGAGLIFLLFGLLLYIVGRSLDVTTLEVGSLLPTLVGVLLVMRGWSAIRAYWFMLFFLIYLIPPPGIVVDALSAGLKPHISSLAAQILYKAGYPVAQDGVILLVGPYRLLVADACSGLNSMFSLSAIGMLYLYLMHYGSWLRNGLILASLLPVAFFANVVRVVTLVLVTYHFGDSAGQGFMHGLSGILLFVVALLSVLVLDTIYGQLSKLRQANR